VDGALYEFKTNDLGLDHSPAGALIAALGALLEEALSGTLRP